MDIDNLHDILAMLDIAVGGDRCMIEKSGVPCDKCPFGTIICKLRISQKVIREHLRDEYVNRKVDD